MGLEYQLDFCDVTAGDRRILYRFRPNHNCALYWSARLATLSERLAHCAKFITKIPIGTGEEEACGTCVGDPPLGCAVGPSGSVFLISGHTTSTGPFAAGVVGSATAATGQVSGVMGNSASSNGIAVFGNAYATSGFAVGVQGKTTSPGGAANW